MKNRMARRAIVLVLLATMMGAACSTTWMGEAEQIVSALIPATANLMALVATLQGRNISAADLQAVQSAGTQAGADLQLMESLIAQYRKADAAAQPGLLEQIQVAMGEVHTSLNGLLPALHVKDAATQAKIAAVVGILLSEVQSMAAIVPLVNGGASPAMMTMAKRRVTKQVPMTASEFVSSYDAVMTAKTGNAELDRAASGLRIHSHGKFARWASGGLLN